MVMYDRRLLGTWRSDLRRTAKDIGARRDISLARRRKIVPIFGRLVLRYTRTRCYSTFRGDHHVRTYKVLARTADSVVTRSTALGLEQDVDVHHIRFESLGPSPTPTGFALERFGSSFGVSRLSAARHYLSAAHVGADHLALAYERRSQSRCRTARPLISTGSPTLAVAGPLALDRAHG